MLTNSYGKAGLFATVVGLLAVGTGDVTRADDTEVYQSTFSAGATGRPKVLIMFDDSGSMDTTVEGERPPYDATLNGTADDYASTANSDYVYWSTSGSPPSGNSNQRFKVTKNRCVSSFTPLDDNGLFQSRARRWIASNSRAYPGDIYDAGWTSLRSGSTDPLHVDCLTDISNDQAGNGSGQADSFPFLPPIIRYANRVQYRDKDLEYSAATAAASNIDWGSTTYTFYSAHYIDYWNDDTLTVDQTRMEIAQEVVSTLISANPGIDFGLGLFNRNCGGYSDRGGCNANGYNGGRIVRGIIADSENATDMQRTAQNTALQSTVAGLTSEGYTPLCESMYEVYNYMAGAPVYYGDDRHSTADSPNRDTTIEAIRNGANSYVSPATDCAYTYVILMTDGKPTRDTNANSRIKTLTGRNPNTYTCGIYEDDVAGTAENCMPELAYHMANTDLDGNSANGNQYGITYTIGFTTNQQLLADTASEGEGAYYQADSADALATAFQRAVASILSTDATFTSPAVAVDSFTRTQSRNDVFFAMFKPYDYVDWPGNIKRLNLALTTDVNTGDTTASLVDKNGDPAIDPATGLIDDEAITYWGTVADGGTVEAGGVGALLAARDPVTRTIKSNTGTNGALEAFDTSNIDPEAFGYTAGDTASLFNFFGVANQAELNTIINWGKGYKLDEDGTTNGTRDWVLADMLHSKPLVVNYGARTGGSPAFTPADPDLRIVVGTNGGFIHMFGNRDGIEDWAFFAKELGPVLTQRSANRKSTNHVYGIDSPAVIYTKDLNFDGTLDHAAGDKVYMYSGLRRGGSMMYALDISNPDSPAFLWRIDNTTSGFSEMGQTWSVPTIKKIPGYVDGNGVPKPVLIFGAGYDTDKDAITVAGPDDVGRGIYIVDAATGALIWSITPAADSATNLQASNLNHSVPASVTALDSNGDELVDRLYFGDAGGQLWRVDMPGNVRPTASQDIWRLTKIADLNDGTTDAADDRRFISTAPDVVRTETYGSIFDAILIGTGDRTNPKALDVTNRFYMIRDERVRPYITDAPTSSDCLADPPSDDFRCNLPLTDSSLYDLTSNPIDVGTAAQKLAASTALAAAHGWRMDLGANGEKNLSRSLTIGGKVYFTTFSPDTVLTNLCEPSPGTSRIYAVDIYDATENTDFNNDNDYERSWVIGSLIPDTPSPHFGPDGEIRILLPPGSGGSGFAGNPLETGASLPQPYGSYWYQEEY
ncbi:MAG: hypothetical protein V7754_06370 [Halioglobus sp.]